MATQEFYIRNASETEAHGPFTQEQLVSLAEAGKVDPQTLYYEAGTEQWIAIGANSELKATLFPEKQRLMLKAKEQRVATVNPGPNTTPPLNVNDMLAAAEGRTAETKDKRDRTVSLERAAAIGRYACVAMLFLSMAALLVPSVDAIAAGDWIALIAEPLVYLGFADFVLMLALLLGAINVYPLVRFRAAIGLGFLGLIFWTQGDIVPVFTIVAGSVGLYLSTIIVSYFALGLSAGLGLAGMLAFAYYMLF